MNAHELATALQTLAKILRSGPNVQLDELEITSSKFLERGPSNSIAVNLSTLASLARIDKAQWLSFINENGFPIPVRPRDASRDILGKVLSYLEENAEAWEKMKEKALKKSGQASPELMRALSFLLRDIHRATPKRD